MTVSRLSLATAKTLQIYHDGSNSVIHDNGTGVLKIRATDFRLSNAGNTQDYIACTDGGDVDLSYAGAVKLSTTSGGITVTGSVQADGLYLGDGESANFGASNDLQIYHDGSNSYISDEGTGDLNIRASDDLRLQVNSGGSWINSIICNDAGSVDLYYNNVKKFETTSYGIDISGSAVADTHNVSSASGAYVQNFDTYQNFKYEMSGNVTLNNPTTEKAGQSGYMIFIQDATGGRTLSLGSEYKTVGGAGITLSTAASAVDIVPYVVQSSGNILLGTPQLAFS